MGCVLAFTLAKPVAEFLGVPGQENVLICGVLCLMAVYYWEVRYLLALEQPGANELLVGSALAIMRASPVWIGFPLSALIFRRRIEDRAVVLAWLPAVFCQDNYRSYPFQRCGKKG